MKEEVRTKAGKGANVPEGNSAQSTSALLKTPDAGYCHNSYCYHGKLTVVESTRVNLGPENFFQQTTRRKKRDQAIHVTFEPR